MYELFDHTADIGLRVRARDLGGLFGDAAAGLFAVIAEDVPPLGTERTLEFHLEGERLDHLLLDWLSELLYVFEVRRLLLRSFVVDVRETRLRAAALARPLDPLDHLLHEVKAVTYHGLRVERTPDGWLAEVILDI